MIFRRSDVRDRGRIRGISLPEILVVIAVIAILAAVGIPILGGVFGSSRAKIAERNLNRLNGALLAYRQASREFSRAVASDTTDELEILRTLQYPDPMVVGSPFLNSRLGIEETSAQDTFRAFWNGAAFSMYKKGEEGAGIDLLKMSDEGTAPQYAEGYKPLGAP